MLKRMVRQVEASEKRTTASSTEREVRRMRERLDHIHMHAPCTKCCYI